MLKATPQRPGPRLVAAAAPHKAAELRDPTHGLGSEGGSSGGSDNDGWHNTAPAIPPFQQHVTRHLGTARASMMA